MSRAFAKDDGPDAPPVVPPRTPLPAGVLNYVTPRGLRLLREEREALTAERAEAEADHSDEAERSRQLSVAAQRLTMLNERIASARLVEPRQQDAARFGATVTYRGADATEQTVTIVGVDEADAAQARIAFTSPVARALTGTAAGETATLSAGGTTETITVLSVRYDA